MERTSQHVADGVLTITMDDGKVNVLSPLMWAELDEGLDRAEQDDVGAVVIAGRPGRFSGGFDLSVLQGDDAGAARGMLRAGFVTAERVLSFPKPVVMACTGHSIAMGSFLMLSGDYRIGAAGDFRIQAIEVAIGMALPEAALAIMRYRLTRPAFDRAVGLAEVFTPETAVTGGYLDRIVAPDDVVQTAQDTAAGFASTLDQQAHHTSKLRARTTVLGELRAAIDADFR
ncbi:MAG: crotonase/enoyl-CoA hydratase family protein [Acidimicrobiales bacterium]|nr:crotonase/enoyl-CoA hydratase family protein [Acidimicrobiales bacterium]